MLKKRKLTASRADIMTLPDERYRSLFNTRNFLIDLVNPRMTPRVPRQVRQRAMNLLRHFPNIYYLDQLCDKLPNQYAKELDPVTKMILDYDRNINNG